METDQTIGFILLGMYLVILWVTRWRFVARPTRHLALAKIDAVRGCQNNPRMKVLLDKAAAYVKSLDEPPDAGVEPRHLEDEYEDWRTLTARGCKQTMRFFTWNGSREMVAWGLVHEAEREAILLEENRNRVDARLRRGLTQVRELPQDDYDHWRDELTNAAEPSTSTDQARATLHQFLKEVYDVRDRRFEELATRENKVTWVILVGIALLTVLVGSDFTSVLLAGAIGGLLSRAQRALQHVDEIGDYGMSWAQLFLAPVAGALAAWAGLVVLVAAEGFGLISSEVLDGLDNLREPGAEILAIALGLGFSERLFANVAGRAQSVALSGP